LVSSTGEVFITGIGDDFAKNWHKSFSEMPVTYKCFRSLLRKYKKS
jgi:hypothetical protein